HQDRARRRLRAGLGAARVSRFHRHVRRHMGQHGGHGPWRHYFGEHMHRRLFWWFGATIFATGAVAAGVYHLFGATGKGRGLVLFAVALTLWMMSGKIARRIAKPLYELV